ncbi:hypothetical protein ABIB26_004064 [Arthrobacter sp. UYEF20]
MEAAIELIAFAQAEHFLHLKQAKTVARHILGPLNI